MHKQHLYVKSLIVGQGHKRQGYTFEWMVRLSRVRRYRCISSHYRLLKNTPVLSIHGKKDNRNNIFSKFRNLSRCGCLPIKLLEYKGCMF